MAVAKELDLWQLSEYTAMKPGLERIKAFLAAIGNPEKRFKAVHIAGTNGKGSTAIMIASILESAGYKTGLYISPHLVRLNERISVNSRQIDSKRLADIGGRYYGLAKKYNLTFFEFITAIAFIYFTERNIDIAVLETGLGGRFDATNVIESPLIAIITGIDYDHTQILGKTITEIAGEKAGIIKQKCFVLSGAENKAASCIIRKAAEKNKCVFWEIKKDFKNKYIKTDWKCCTQYVRYSGAGLDISLRVPLLGIYQRKNSSLAAAAAQMLNELGFLITDKAVVNGIANAKWPGRFDVRQAEVNGCNRTIILDGAHNPQAMSSFVSSFKESRWAEKSKNVIFGVLQDKDYIRVAKEALKLGGSFMLTPVKSRRTLDKAELETMFKTVCKNNSFAVTGSLEEALSKTDESVIVITGSLYLVGEALKKLNIKGTRS